jgi:hypothetical protein
MSRGLGRPLSIVWANVAHWAGQEWFKDSDRAVRAQKETLLQRGAAGSWFPGSCSREVEARVQGTRFSEAGFLRPAELEQVEFIHFLLE